MDDGADASVLDELNAVHSKVESLLMQRKAADASAAVGRGAAGGAAAVALRLHNLAPEPEMPRGAARARGKEQSDVLTRGTSVVSAPPRDAAAPTAAATEDALVLELARAEIEGMIAARCAELDTRGAFDEESNATRARSLVMLDVSTDAGRAALARAVERARAKLGARELARPSAAADAPHDQRDSASARLQRTLGQLARQLDHTAAVDARPGVIVMGAQPNAQVSTPRRASTRAGRADARMPGLGAASALRPGSPPPRMPPGGVQPAASPNARAGERLTRRALTVQEGAPVDMEARRAAFARATMLIDARKTDAVAVAAAAAAAARAGGALGAASGAEQLLSLIHI